MPEPQEQAAQPTVDVILVDQPVEFIPQEFGSAVVANRGLVHVEILGPVPRFPEKPTDSRGSAALGPALAR